MKARNARETYMENLKERIRIKVSETEIMVSVYDYIDEDNEAEFHQEKESMRFFDEGEISEKITEEVGEAARDLMLDFEINVPEKNIQTKVEQIVETICDLFEDDMTNKLSNYLGCEAMYREWLCS